MFQTPFTRQGLGFCVGFGTVTSPVLGGSSASLQRAAKRFEHRKLLHSFLAPENCWGIYTGEGFRHLGWTGISKFLGRTNPQPYKTPNTHTLGIQKGHKWASLQGDSHGISLSSFLLMCLFGALTPQKVYEDFGRASSVCDERMALNYRS